MKRLALLLGLTLPLGAHAQFIVEDPWASAQRVVMLARMGDPAAITALTGMAQLKDSLGNPGVGLPLMQIVQAASGVEALYDTGNGLYRPLAEWIITADGRQLMRLIEAYRRYDAIAKTAVNYQDVHDDTEVRRMELRGQMQSTTRASETALTQAAVDKLNTIVAAQGAELAAIDREREAAASRVLVQDVLNRNDEAKQKRARTEDQAAALQEGSDKLAAFLQPDARPLRIPETGQNNLR